MARYTSFIAILLLLTQALLAQVTNFSASGEQATRFDNLRNAVDAHDGMIAYFDGTYYLYGTSYDCGFEWNNKTAPFCGFKVYTSTDLSNWKDNGFLFDAKTQLWQQRCNGKTYGCFRPHVVYNKKTRNYVLWINVYDNVIGYRVFTSRSPVGPFTEVAEPKLVINKDKPAAQLNNGDHDLFVDDNGTAYLAMTDWRAEGALAIEQLTDDYLSGTGKVVTKITSGKTEAPGLFKRKGKYYITYSDPNCGYCSGTGTSYKTAASIFGPWSDGIQISNNSCGGQPSFVATFRLPGETVYLYGSDLWNNAAKNEALANFFWVPLEFNSDGSIKPIECVTDFQVGSTARKPKGDTLLTYKAVCDITGDKQLSQHFTVPYSGLLKHIILPLLKSGYPNEALVMEVYEIGQDSEALMNSIKIDTSELGWSARMVKIACNLKVDARNKYRFVLRTNAGQGCFGYAKLLNPPPGDESLLNYYFAIDKNQ